MTRYTDLGDKERDDLHMIIQADTSRIGVDRYDGTFSGNIHNVKKFELCSDCENFHYAKTKYSIKVARCSMFEVRLNESDPVIECTRYDQRYVMTLTEMKSIAFLIESCSKPKIGLIKDEE